MLIPRVTFPKKDVNATGTSARNLPPAKQIRESVRSVSYWLQNLAYIDPPPHQAQTASRQWSAVNLLQHLQQAIRVWASIRSAGTLVSLRSRAQLLDQRLGQRMPVRRTWQARGPEVHHRNGGTHGLVSSQGVTRCLASGAATSSSQSTTAVPRPLWRKPAWLCATACCDLQILRQTEQRQSDTPASSPMFLVLAIDFRPASVAGTEDIGVGHSD